MKKIAVLGPPGTFSDLAAQKFAKNIGESYQLRFYPHLQRVLQAGQTECDFAVVPIENVSEGFVPVVLDHLVDSPLIIRSELNLPVAFDYVGCEPPVLKQLFVQFVARGQCREFIDGLGEIELIATESNIESMERATKCGEYAGAIVPSHIAERGIFNWHQSGVHDYAHNQTRFLLLHNGLSGQSQGEKTSVLVVNKADRPGLLEQVLHCFSTRRLNLTSIVSRPTGQGFGKYHFFIDVEADLTSIAMRAALRSIESVAEVKVLGSYYAFAE